MYAHLNLRCDIIAIIARKVCPMFFGEIPLSPALFGVLTRINLDIYTNNIFYNLKKGIDRILHMWYNKTIKKQKESL